MTVVYIISFLLIAFGIVRILGLTPESIGADVSSILDRKKSLRDNAMRARGKKRTNKLVLWLDKIRRALSDTGKEKSFGVACAVALLLMILGSVGAIVIGNPFLAPVLAIALAMIPFLYLLRTVEQYEEQVKLELETGLSAITSSYERTMNLKSAVEENIDNLKPPVKGLFQSFLVEISVINPDVKAAICHLRERVKDCVWEEWCDTLISCQDDSQLIGTLYPVVEKLTDMRIVNAELKVMISENKREYYTEPLSVNSTASGTTSIRLPPSSTATDLWMNRCSVKRSLPYSGWNGNLHAPLHRRADGGHGDLECQGQCGEGSSLCCEPGKDMERTVCGSCKVPHGGEGIGV